ncbi:MAG TPA: hypothetical protein VMN36_11110 [Verrucomicrobiales bacterium]|nr:hypothetical protein [Verrucomicrobiales bacterium]
MISGELLTRLSIWLAVTAYAIACAGMLLRREQRVESGWIRVVWTLGCGFFLVHVACAFGFYHEWSHADAYRATARQTAEMTGTEWGGGVYFNYLFAAFWSADALWQWSAPSSFARRPKIVAAVLHGYLFFMVFNGAFIFVRGPAKWLGLLLCAGVAVLWARNRWVATRQRAAQQS